MKKIIALFLAMVMIFAVSACGMSESDQAYSEAEALIASEQYDEALAVLNSIESYKKISSKIAEVEELKAELEQNRLEEEYKNKPRKEIDLTVSNFEEYFEFIKIPVFNAFGDLSEIYCKIFPKDNVLDTIDYTSDFELSIKLYTEGKSATVQYDKDTNTFTYGPSLPNLAGNKFVKYPVLTLTNEDLQVLAENKGSENRDENYLLLGNIWTDWIIFEDEQYGCYEWTYEIEDVIGKLVVFE